MPTAIAATTALGGVPARRPGGFDPTPKRYSRLLGDTADWTRQPGSLVPLITTEFRVRAERRTAALLLALRLYRLDHPRWPTALAELVPTYLPAVPLDPVAGNGRPIGYLVVAHAQPTGGDRVLLYWGRPTNGPAGPPPAGFASSHNDSYRGLVHWRDAADWSAAATRPAGR